MNGVRSIICALSLLAFCPQVGADVLGRPQTGTNADAVDRNDPNFVKASLLVVSRGEVLFSCAGHTAFRMECPKYNLDYCFTYESESIGDRIWAFFCGRLTMGLFSVQTKDFLSEYAREGRGVVQYPMNLPPAVKARLWKILDEKAAEGANLPYEYLKRGCCVQTAFNILEDAIAPLKLDSSQAKELPYSSIREVFTAEVTPTHPWAMFMLHAICGTGVDRPLSKSEKLVVPQDLAEYLRKSRLAGAYVVDKEEEVIPVSKHFEKSFFTPLRLSLVFLLICLVAYLVDSACLDWALLLVQTAAGAFFTYLVCFSKLPGTTWNWLIVPFNLLPFVFWRWRRCWALPYAAVLAAWEAYMLFNGQTLTDSAYLVLTFAYIVFYLRFTRLPSYFGRVAPQAKGAAA